MRPFKSPKKVVGSSTGDLASVLTTTADIALVIDKRGIVRDLMSSSDVFSDAMLDGWLGKKFISIVTPESVSKVESLLEAEAPSNAPARQVNHPTAGNGSSVLKDIPVSYTMVALKEGGRRVAVGREHLSVARLQQRLVETQQRLEGEFSRIRRVEARYRALFDMTSEAVLLVDGADLEIVDANDAALALLEKTARRVKGKTLPALFASESSEALRIMTAAVRTAPQSEPAHLITADTKRAIDVSMTMMNSEIGVLFMVQLNPPDAASLVGAAGNTRFSLLGAVSQLPDGFVVANENRRIVSANRSFVELVQLATEQQVTGETLENWIGRTRVDLDILLANLRERGKLQGYVTRVRGRYGSEQEVELSAAVIPDSDPMHFGLCIRPINAGTGTLAAPEDDPLSLPRSAEQVTELVGRVPLKDLVRETTDIIERLCIEAALDLTDDNRASAAEMLGLSRQSFYVKLRRFGMVEAKDG